MNNALTPAVIVMRHFEDLPNPPPPWPGPFCYKMPSAPSIGIPWRRLNPDGIKGSLNYGTALPNLIQSLNLCPVSRVITQDPRTKEQTQNPFDTVYPFLFGQKLQDVKLLSKGSDLVATPHNALLPPDGSHSTLICWDRQTLWGDKTFDPRLFLGQMRRGTTPSLDNPPVKAPTKGSQGIYVFTNYKSDDKFDLVIHPTFTDLANQGPQPTPGPC